MSFHHFASSSSIGLKVKNSIAYFYSQILSLCLAHFIQANFVMLQKELGIAGQKTKKVQISISL